MMELPTTRNGGRCTAGFSGGEAQLAATTTWMSYRRPTHQCGAAISTTVEGDRVSAKRERMVEGEIFK
jgi:hypothetical protein